MQVGEDMVDNTIKIENPVARARQLIKLIDIAIGELPERGEDFGSSVGEKAESIEEWIDEKDAVTAKQLTALENMLAGLERWQR
jgi:hypothetical protein